MTRDNVPLWEFIYSQYCTRHAVGDFSTCIIFSCAQQPHFASLSRHSAVLDVVQYLFTMDDISGYQAVLTFFVVEVLFLDSPSWSVGWVAT